MPHRLFDAAFLTRDGYAYSLFSICMLLLTMSTILIPAGGILTRGAVQAIAARFKCGFWALEVASG
ncbi:hypothetical protein GQ53DRAFT_746740 [Thozetella sp. PMI_491]|nr:hypothetical protein GQ53DRAFT_746740 [Thozetella sp. PMI_491]